MRSFIPMALLALPLAGCFLLPPYGDGTRSEPPFFEEDGSSTVDVFHDEPTELVVFVDHERGSENVESGVLESLDGRPIAVFERVRDNRWIASVAYDALDALEPVEEDPQDYTAFAVFETKWGESADQELTLRARCGGGALLCDGVCQVCDACSDEGACIGLSRCFSGGFTTSVTAQCTASGFSACAPADVAGDTSVVLIEYQDSGCTDVSRTYRASQITCGGQYEFPAGAHFQGVCAD